MKLNKPGRKVYVIYDCNIFLESAAYIGKHSFIVGGYEWRVDDAREWYYEDYGTTWFTSLAAAKKFLLQDNLTHSRTGKIIQFATGCWEFKEAEVNYNKKAV